MKLKSKRNLQWRLILLVSIVCLNVLTAMALYNDNMSLFTNNNTQISKSTTNPYSLSENTNTIQKQINRSNNLLNNDSDLNTRITASNTGNVITRPAVQSSASLASLPSQTQAFTGISQANVLVNDTVDTLFNNANKALNLSNGFGNQVNNNASVPLITIPNNYVNTSGTFNITNLNAGLQSTYVCGNTTSPASTIFNPPSGITKIATSFTVTQNRINITRLQFYYQNSGTSGGASVYITGITSSKPNSTIYGRTLTPAFSSTGSAKNYATVSYGTSPVTLFKGIYSVVLVSSSSKATLYSQPDSVTGNKSQMWTYTSGTGWTNISQDLIFGYTYILVNNNNQTLNYTSPQQVNLNYNGTALNSLTNISLLLNGSKLYFTANIAVTFNLTYIIHYKYISNPIEAQIIYNSINGTDTVWNITVTDKAIPFPTTGSGNYTVVNHTLLISNLSSDWDSIAIYRNISLYVSNINGNSTITYTNGSSQLLLNISSISAPYNWTFSFTSPNYIQSLTLVQNNVKTLTFPYQVNSTDTLSVTSLTDSSASGQNGSLFIYSSLNTIVYNETDIGISGGQLNFNSWNISKSLNLNTDVDGSYFLNIQWINTNQTEVGFISVIFKLFMQTQPLLVSTNSTLYVQGEFISLTADYLSAYNETNLNLANLTYLNSWDSSHGTLVQSSSHSSYTTDISTANILQGSYHITIFASLGGYVNRSISVPIQVVVKLQTSAIQKNIVSGLSKLGYTQTLNLFWNISYNNSLVTNPTYALMLNNTLITNYHADGIFPTNSTSGNSFSLQLKIDFDPVVYNFTRGLYNYTVSFSNRFLIGQVLSLPIFVTGYNLNLTLEYNSQLFHTSSFPITAKVTYATSSSSTIFSSSNLEEPRLLTSHTRNTVLSTYTQAPFPGSAVVGIELFFNIGVILSNGTGTIFSTVLMTDSSGKAIYIIPQTDTALINSFSYFNVSISQSTYNEAYSYSDTAVKTGITLQTGSNSEIYFIFLLVVILILVLIIGSYSAYVFIRGRQFTTQKQKQNYYNQLMLISNIYALLVTTSSGLPILTTIKKGLSENTEITSLISGLSVGMDSFLQNFQQDFFVHLNHGSQETETNSQTVLSDETTQVPPGAINVSTVDRETFKILIASSSSFRMFVFLKEKTFAGIDTLFRSIITTLEHNLVLDDIIDDSIITPQVEKIVNSYFPLALLRTFTVDMQRFARLVAESQTTAQPSLSAEALNALKSMLIVRSGQLSGQDLTLEKSRKLFDELLQTGHLPASGTFKFEEALTILEKQLKLAPKIIFELLWTGALYDVRLFVPVTT